MRQTLLQIIPLFALAACASPQPPKVEIPAEVLLLSEKQRCNALEPGYRDIIPSQRIVRPGDTISFQVGIQSSISGFTAFPKDCLKNWRIEPADLSSLNDKTATLKISDAAPSGSQIDISVMFFGESIKRTIKITGRDEVVLTGIRSQKEGPDCPGATHVGEIDFKDDGRFGVTFAPFESYVDYWGTYSFDSKTGALTMKTDGGNFIPSDLDLEGKAWLEPNGVLHLDGFNLGGRNASAPMQPMLGENPPPAPECRYIFYAG